MKWLDKIRTDLMGVDPDYVMAYRSAIPSTVDLQISVKGDSYIAIIKTVDNEQLPKETFLITEAESSEALVDMVNDLIFSYKNIPETYRRFYKQILRPEGSVAKTKNLKLIKAS